MTENLRKFAYIFKNQVSKYHHLPHPHPPANRDVFKYPQCFDFNLREEK